MKWSKGGTRKGGKKRDSLLMLVDQLGDVGSSFSRADFGS